MALRSRARALLRGPEIQLRPAETPPIVGRARLGRKTKDLVKRLGPGDIAVIDHADLDRIAAEDLAASGVEAVVNVAQSSTDRYPNPGPLILARAGVRAASTCRRRRCSRSSPTATRSRSRAARCAPTASVLATGRVIDLATATEQIERQRERINEALSDFAANTIEHVERRGRAARRQDRLPATCAPTSATATR